MRMLSFAFKSMATRRAKLIMTALSVVIAAGVALLAYNISTQVSEGIVNTAAKYDIIIGPSGSATQLAMNTMFFTDKPLGTIPYAVIDDLNRSGQVNAAIPFSMGDSYNAAPIVGTDPALLSDKALLKGDMFTQPLEAVVGFDVAKTYRLNPGDQIISSHGLSHDGAAHADHPLNVVGVLKRTDTAYDNAVFTPVSTIWELHEHHDEDHDEDHDEGHDEDHDEDHDGHEEHRHAEEGEICAVLVRSKSLADYAALMKYYADSTDYLAINPNTVLREVMDNVDLSRKIVYILCAVILVMNLFVVSVIALLNMYDSRREIALMRLIGVSMGKINRLYLIQNALTGLCAVALSLLCAHLCLWGIRGFVSRMGIVLNAARVYPLEWAILLSVFALSILPTAVLTRRMARKDSLET
ncbi:MAG: FtsX-like permease family protein [Clostridia bacterium]|nr:FtsX-like permease family protein [Clostridia bacterium]